MRIAPGFVFAFSLLLIVWWIGLEIVTDYKYDKAIGSYWGLGVKASTLQQKSAFLDKYIAAIESEGLYGNDAIILPTPDNAYEQNMVALKSLQGRMHQIQGMDEQSFAYQTAMQQITAQEQGEASHLTDTFKGIWFRRKHVFLYSWVDFLVWLGFIAVAVFAGRRTFKFS
jgi:hypothetical protein